MNDLPFCSLRPVTNTFEPNLDSSCATSPPIPDVPPVTKEILSIKFF